MTGKHLDLDLLEQRETKLIEIETINKEQVWTLKKRQVNK